jgi:formylglycine-generating enzyme required for sulfatase activity
MKSLFKLQCPRAFPPLIWGFFSLLIGFSSATANGQITVSNVRAAQRVGTKLVYIDYDVAGATAPVAVSLLVSPDGGATWAVPVTSATGAVGNAVTAGSNLRITWDAGVDWNGQYSTQTRFRVSVEEKFVKVDGGTLPSTSGLGALPVSTFYIGKYEVRWDEFQTVRTWAAANGYDIGGVGAGTGSSYPVTSVNWYSAVKWCNARSQMEGKTPAYTVGGVVYRTGDQVPVVNASANGYRLPSEKEWEWAARGGTQTQGYAYSGSNDVNAVAWYSSNSGSATHVVGTKAANELGTYDMSGNVWEWCFDIYSGSLRVIRGGSWNSGAENCPVGYRGNINPTYGNINFGFRLALSSVP